jgi:hypothetical protein
MKCLALAFAVVVLCACGQGPAPIRVAEDTIKPGMTIEDVEAELGGPGIPVPADPNGNTYEWRVNGKAVRVLFQDSIVVSAAVQNP